MFHPRLPKGAGSWQMERWERGSRAGLGASKRGGATPRQPQGQLSFFSSLALLNFLKAPNSNRDSGVHYIELPPPFQAKINLAAPRGKGRGRKWEAKGKNSLDQFPLANMITRLPGSSASCWQASWPPASRAQLLAVPRHPPEWDRLAGVTAPGPPG